MSITMCTSGLFFRLCVRECNVHALEISVRVVQSVWRGLQRDISHARMVMGLILLSFSTVVAVMRGSICPC